MPDTFDHHWQHTNSMMFFCKRRQEPNREVEQLEAKVTLLQQELAALKEQFLKGNVSSSPQNEFSHSTPLMAPPLKITPAPVAPLTGAPPPAPPLLLPSNRTPAAPSLAPSLAPPLAPPLAPTLAVPVAPSIAVPVAPRLAPAPRQASGSLLADLSKVKLRGVSKKPAHQKSAEKKSASSGSICLQDLLNVKLKKSGTNRAPRKRSAPEAPNSIGSISLAAIAGVKLRKTTTNANLMRTPQVKDQIDFRKMDRMQLRSASRIPTYILHPYQICLSPYMQSY